MTRFLVLLLPVLLFFTQAGAAVRIDTMELRSSLYDIDRLIREGDYPAAEAALQRLAGSGVGEARLRLRRAQLAAVSGDHAAAIRICRDGLPENVDGRRLRMQLIESLAASDSLSAADREVAVYLADAQLNPREGQLVVDIWLQHGQPQRGLAVCDTLRSRYRDPMLLTRSRAACLADLGRYRETAAQYLAYLQASPHAQTEVRSEIPDRLPTDEAAREFTAGLRDSLQSPGATQAVLLSLDILLGLGDVDQATDMLKVYDWSPRSTVWMIQLIDEMIDRLPTTDPPQLEARRRWLVTSLTDIFDRQRISGRQIPMLQDLAADLVLTILDAEGTTETPEGLRRDLDALLDRMETAGPSPDRMNTVRIRLAELACRRGSTSPQVLGDLQLLSETASSYEVRGQALLALGRCQLASLDTITARRTLAALEAGALVTEARLNGSFLLAQLDVAQDQWDSARERLAALASADPAADIANDALDQGLLLAEMIDDPLLDPRARILWSRVTLDLLLQRQSDRYAALSDLSGLAEAASSPATRSVCEQALLDLARLQVSRGDTLPAIDGYGRLVLDYPDGRYPAQALLCKGDLQAVTGRMEDAVRSWELLLVQYPTTPQAEDARRRLQEKR